MNVNDLVDQPARTLFIEGHGINISVIAPAGVGKTTAIVNRIIHLARLPEAEAVKRLTRLVVVTYSVRAAQQMQQRARIAIRQAETTGTPIPPRVQRAFQQTFFGTIHSFCVRLLDRFGHYLGLPSPVALLQDEEEIWRRFLLRGLDPALGDDPHLRELFHFYSPEQLYGLGRVIPPGEIISTTDLPELDIASLLAFDPAGLHSATRKTIVRAQTAAARWIDLWRRGERFRPLPYCPDSNKAAAYSAIYRQTFAPLHAWMHETTPAFGRRVANAYEHFRLSEAFMTYDDQVRLALRVLDNLETRRELANESYSVLLDEAQDTDPLQFEVLRRVAGLGGDIDQPEAQNFSIVGDFQQAIYAPRSDLATYRTVHDEIQNGPRGATSQLQVTFRCEAAIIDFVNRIFPAILHNTGGQAGFETLVAKNGAGAGQVVRLTVPDLRDDGQEVKIKSASLFQHEATFIAHQIAELGFAGLGARSWSEVAILCPRKNWLLDLQHALGQLGLRVQLHSSDETPRDRMSGAWLTALVWIAAHPEDTFEITGVLREVLGVADSDIALFTGGNGEKLRLDHTTAAGAGPVPIALALLRHAVADAETKSIGELVLQLVNRTQLRARLQSIPDADAEDVDRELDDFLAAIAGRSAVGASLAELARDLRSGLALAAPMEEEIHQDAIQMMTSHKAKGLEWDAVIVPYVFRRIEWKHAEFPRVVSLGAADAIICRDKAEYNARARDIVTLRERQQCQRLYYVMCTRARRTLVFFDDEALMARQRHRPGEIPGEFLSFTGGPNREVFHRLPREFTLIASTVPEEASATPLVPDLVSLTADNVKEAITRAGLFPRRITPHALARHVGGVSSDAEPEAQADQEEETLALEPRGPGILYGTFWHEFIQTIPWQKPPTHWQERFTEAQPFSPQPERFAREWEILRHSELARWLAERGRILQIEMPFLWQEVKVVGSKNKRGLVQTELSFLAPTEAATGAWIEGVIDLAVYSIVEKTWRVIDWKTNRVGDDGSAPLVDIYRGQIEAYVRALRQMLSAEVRGFLYLTQTGDLVEIA